jgi:hypothetical protein
MRHQVTKEKRQEYRETFLVKHPMKEKEYRSAFRRKNPKPMMLYRARNSAKLRGLECTLVLSDIPPTPEFCPVFPWIRLEYKVGMGIERRGESPSLDRINNNRGYVAGNVRIISDRANRLKGNATYLEIKALWADFERQKMAEV